MIEASPIDILFKVNEKSYSIPHILVLVGDKTYGNLHDFQDMYYHLPQQWTMHDLLADCWLNGKSPIQIRPALHRLA